MSVLVLGPDEHEGLVTFAEGCAWMEAGFRDFATSPTRLSNPRTRTNTQNGFRMTLHQGVVPSVAAAFGSVRSELVEIQANGKQRYATRGVPVFVFFDQASAELRMIMVGEPRPKGLEHVRGIGGFQTSCCAAVCTDLLARPEAARVGILGSGAQARFHLAALAARRRLGAVTVYSPNAENRRRFAEEMSALLDLDVRAAETTREVVRDAEILLVCTNSNVPVLDGADLAPGTHVTSIVHSNKEMLAAGLLPKMRQEIDDATVRRAGLVATTTKAQEELDQPEVLYGMARRGVLAWEDVVEIADVITGRVAVDAAAGPERITFLHNPGAWGIGMAAILRGYYEKATAQGLGSALPLPVREEETAYV